MRKNIPSVGLAVHGHASELLNKYVGDWITRILFRR